MLANCPRPRLITGDTAPDRLAEARASGLVLHKPLVLGKLRAATNALMPTGSWPLGWGARGRKIRRWVPGRGVVGGKSDRDKGLIGTWFAPIPDINRPRRSAAKSRHFSPADLDARQLRARLSEWLMVVGSDVPRIRYSD